MKDFEIICIKCSDAGDDVITKLLVTAVMYGAQVLIAVKCPCCGSVEQVEDALTEVLTSDDFATKVEGGGIKIEGVQTGRTKMTKSNIEEVIK